MTWIEDQTQKRIPLSTVTITAKAKSLFVMLKEKAVPDFAQRLNCLGRGHICHGGRGVSKICGHYQFYGGRSISTVTQCSSHICFYFSGSRTACL